MNKKKRNEISYKGDNCATISSDIKLSSISTSYTRESTVQQSESTKITTVFEHVVMCNHLNGT